MSEQDNPLQHSTLITNVHIDFVAKAGVLNVFLFSRCCAVRLLHYYRVNACSLKPDR